MSHTVLRGEPYPSQLYLDTVLNAIIEDSRKDYTYARTRDDVNLGEIIYYCMKRNLNALYMINAATGEKVTNEQLLGMSVPLARAFIGKGLKEKTVLLVTSNQKQMAALYYAMNFAGVLPLFVDPNSTVYELRYFVSLVSPEIIFCDRKRYVDVSSMDQDVIVVVADEDDELQKFYNGYSDDVLNFKVTNISNSSPFLMLPTSGSSGLPKATILTHEGMIAQLPILWVHEHTFPRPTNLAMLVSTAQWMTHTAVMTSCPVFQVPLLMTPQKSSAAHIVEIVEKYRPSWALFGPAFAKSLAALATSDQLASLEIFLTTGSPLSRNIREVLEEKLSEKACLSNGIGMTEVHGFFAIPRRTAHPDSNGTIHNTFEYKIFDEDGNELGLKQKGELWLRSKRCVFKGYLNNEESYRESVTPDGWLKTGDVVYIDENEEMYFIERKKFWFKYMNYHISPEEVEYLIGSIPGVMDCVVCGTEKGPAAAVVLLKGAEELVTREVIHSVVKSKLSDYKRLRGGIVFIDALPCTYTGKVKRMECQELVKSLVEKNQCVESDIIN